MKKIYMIVSHKVTKAMRWTIDYLSSFEENIILIITIKKVILMMLLILQRIIKMYTF